ncbi:MAG: 3-deoxy-8-phosphooctulonate synthase, partial [Puniceicoccales bacterium]|nr:3-deoxy-8-phosphooctulonate synthase [Puniceicoccales bacterium]
MCYLISVLEFMLFNHKQLLIIAGPCALESEELVFEVANYLANIKEAFPEVQFIFKTSFDKANRSSFKGNRGIGLIQGLTILQHIKERYRFPMTTDIHLPEQAASVG